MRFHPDAPGIKIRRLEPKAQRHVSFVSFIRTVLLARKVTSCAGTLRAR